MRGAIAVARITVLGVVRRGILPLIAAELAVVAVAALLVPVTVEAHHAARLRLVLFAGGECALLLATLVAAFGAATAIPADAVSKRLYLVLTKPCSRGGMVLGRFLGYAAALAVLHVVWWVIILAAVLVGRLRGDIEAEQMLVRAPVPAVSVEVSGPTAFPYRQGDDEHDDEEGSATGEHQGEHDGDHHAALVDAGADGAGIHGEVWLLGGTGDTAVFRFTGLQLTGDDLGAELELDLGAEFKAGKGPLRSSEVAVSIARGDGWTEPIIDRVRFRKPMILSLDPQLIEHGALSVKLERRDDRFDIYLRADRARVREPEGSLVENCASTMLLLWMRSVLVIAMGVLSSALFSGPVAVLFTFFLTLLSQIAGFLERYSRTVLEAAQMVAEMGKEAFHATQHAGHTHGFDAPSEAAVALARLGEQVTWLLPHFEDFDSRVDLIRGLRVPFGQLAGCAGTTAFYSAALLCIAVVVFRRRSLA